MKLYGITKLGPKGQVVIPQEAREDLGLKPGDRVVIFAPSEKGIVVASAEEMKKYLNDFSDLFGLTDDKD